MKSWCIAVTIMPKVVTDKICNDFLPSDFKINGCDVYMAVYTSVEEFLKFVHGERLSVDDLSEVINNYKRKTCFETVYYFLNKEDGETILPIHFRVFSQKDLPTSTQGHMILNWCTDYDYMCSSSRNVIVDKKEAIKYFKAEMKKDYEGCEDCRIKDDVNLVCDYLYEEGYEVLSTLASVSINAKPCMALVADTTIEKYRYCSMKDLFEYVGNSDNTIDDTYSPLFERLFMEANEKEFSHFLSRKGLTPRGSKPIYELIYEWG